MAYYKDLLQYLQWAQELRSFPDHLFLPDK